MKTNIITLLSYSNSGRMMKRLIPVLAFCGLIGLLAGCASGPATTTARNTIMYPAGFGCPTNTPAVIATTPWVTSYSPMD